MNIKEKVLKEIKELKEKIKIEEKRDIYSGELVRMYSKLKILESKLKGILETHTEVGKVIDEVDDFFKTPGEEWDTGTSEIYTKLLKEKLGIK